MSKQDASETNEDLPGLSISPEFEMNHLRRRFSETAIALATARRQSALGRIAMTGR
jgi:hypothetical protein